MAGGTASTGDGSAVAPDAAVPAESAGSEPMVYADGLSALRACPPERRAQLCDGPGPQSPRRMVPPRGRETAIGPWFGPILGFGHVFDPPVPN